VLPENVLTKDECEALKADMYKIEAAYQNTGDLPEGMDPNHYSWFTATEPDFFRIDNLPHLTRSFYDYVTHPRLLAMMEEITGVEVRLEQCDAHIRRPVLGAQPKPGEPLRYGLHGGLRGYMGRAFEHTDKGLYHYSFVKTLTNLSDLGPDDGTDFHLLSTLRQKRTATASALLVSIVSDGRDLGCRWYPSYRWQP
jgi:hypothetical protein